MSDELLWETEHLLDPFLSILTDDERGDRRMHEGEGSKVGRHRDYLGRRFLSW
jgi:hypothetical protein